MAELSAEQLEIRVARTGERVQVVSYAGHPALFWHCRGCGSAHLCRVASPGAPEPAWTWDGDRVNPTLEPSILGRAGDQRCHSFLRGGRVQFLGDSTHDLAGQTVELELLEVPS